MNVAAVIITAAAVVAALTALWRVRLVQWLWHRNVTEPVKGLVQSAVQPMIDALDDKNTRQHADSQRLHREWRDTVTQRFDSIDSKVKNIDTRTTNIEKYLTDPNKENP